MPILPTSCSSAPSRIASISSLAEAEALGHHAGEQRQPAAVQLRVAVARLDRARDRLDRGVERRAQALDQAQVLDRERDLRADGGDACGAGSRRAAGSAGARPRARRPAPRRRRAARRRRARRRCGRARPRRRRARPSRARQPAAASSSPTAAPPARPQSTRRPSSSPVGEARSSATPEAPTTSPSSESATPSMSPEAGAAVASPTLNSVTSERSRSTSRRWKRWRTRSRPST